MLHTSLRIIHQTDEFTITRFRSGKGRDVFVIEHLDDEAKVIDVTSLSGEAAALFLSRWSAVIGRSANTRPLKEPLAVDAFLNEMFFPEGP